MNEGDRVQMIGTDLVGTIISVRIEHRSLLYIVQWDDGSIQRCWENSVEPVTDDG